MPETTPHTATNQPSGHHHHSTPPVDNKPVKKRRLAIFSGAFGYVYLFIASVIVAWGITAFLFQLYQVDGPSMLTTLQNGNRLIVWKAPKTWSEITGHPYIPNRGDIVVFVENNLYSYNNMSSDQLIKRVVGLPGDRVIVNNGVITIYNKQHPNGFDPDTSLPYGKVIGETSGNINITVPPDQIFVCGDNRSNSLDSRVFGTVPVKNIIGKLVVRLTPFSELSRF